MASPRSPITILGDALARSVALKGWAQVLVGAKKIAEAGKPPRIVIFPGGGNYASAHDNVTAIRDVDLQIGARLWGESIDQAAELEQRYFQALQEQADANGLFWQALTCTWSDATDTAAQGQELEVLISIRLPIDRVALTYGQVDAVGMVRSTELAADLAAAATTAVVTSTFGAPSAGVLRLGDELASYTGLSATSFTGLTRGTNAVDLAAGTVVDVSPT